MFTFPKQYDVIVVGAGHAGIEAALAAARMGCETLLLTINADTVAQMSCNPAIGGLAKGHLAREIDALGGEMAKVTDMTGLQFRMLNTKKGPAVWAPRAQCDKKAYQFRMKWACEREANLDLRQGLVSSIIHRDGQVIGVETTLDVQYHGQTVIITTGTFLNGLMHIGKNQQAGGRSGEASAVGVSASLCEIGLELGRLKTGTPPRLLRRSIDFSKTEIQPGDDLITYFTHWKDDLFHVEQSNPSPRDMFHVEHHKRWFDQPSRFRGKYPPGSILECIDGQLPCYITYTTKETAQIIRANLHKSPLYSGTIQGVGPRYCPSIEDKIVRFSHKDTHQIFLEPEGISTDEIYVNGFSTSLPFEIQVELVKTIIGCEKAEILRPAYAVEYDFVFPTQLQPSLETKVCRNLYLAGQVNGTSGYEEAAAQGLMAGVNAARRVKNLAPIILRRDQAYIGVLIDDLVTKGTAEPYRMFTSRAEYRLLLRQDNADKRLSQIGYEVGLLQSKHYQQWRRKDSAIEAEIARLETTKCGSSTLAQLLRRPDISYSDLHSQDESLSEEVITRVEVAIKYAGYIARQANEISKLKNLEDKQIPGAFDYATVPSLRIEARQKLMQIRPATLGQASRISGVSPADVSILMVWLKRSAAESESLY
ncbi:MAG: tRNA uridine-5-carboxymethylaminomethyl(34) synthesis enzyme MnmG [Verrucomicrobia bacterium]|nr:tRNA uridine-5-carboxymethylaminomethyl(34) synthesis enzyme MnmG [Verrucomicrobiota bacterium]